MMWCHYSKAHHSLFLCVLISSPHMLCRPPKYLITAVPNWYGNYRYYNNMWGSKGTLAIKCRKMTVQRNRRRWKLCFWIMNSQIGIIAASMQLFHPITSCYHAALTAISSTKWTFLWCMIMLKRPCQWLMKRRLVGHSCRAAQWRIKKFRSRAGALTYPSQADQDSTLNLTL